MAYISGSSGRIDEFLRNGATIFVVKSRLASITQLNSGEMLSISAALLSSRVRLKGPVNTCHEDGKRRVHCTDKTYL